MNRSIFEDAVLKPTPWCTVRQQEYQYLIYNSHTDELYLVPYSGYYVLRLCDGLATVSNIEDQLDKVIDSRKNQISHRVQEFLSSLMERGILEVHDDNDAVT